MSLVDKLLNRRQDGIRVSIDRETFEDALIRTNRMNHQQKRLMDVDIDEVDVSIDVDDEEIPEDMSQDEVKEFEQRMAAILYEKLVLKQ